MFTHMPLSNSFWDWILNINHKKELLRGLCLGTLCLQSRKLDTLEDLERTSRHPFAMGSWTESMRPSHILEVWMFDGRRILGDGGHCSILQLHPAHSYSQPRRHRVGPVIANAKAFSPHPVQLELTLV